MPIKLSSRILCGQVILGLLCVVGLLVVQRQTFWGSEQHSTLQAPTPVKDQHREIQSDSQSQVSTESGRSPVQSPENSTEQPIVSAPKKYQSSVPEDDIPGHHKHHAWLQSHKQGDLPLLPFDRSPDSDTWDNSVSICAVMLQENITDVREWLIYHRWLGVDHVYLTENSDPIPSVLVEGLQDLVDDGFLTLESDPKKANQLPIYKRCLEQHRHKYNWMAFIDIDEYIVIRTNGVTLKQFLDGFKHEAGVLMHWILMGSNGRETRPEKGGVLRHYDQCDKDPSVFVKTIANTYFIANHGGNVHNYEYRDNIQAVDEYGREMAPRYPPPEICSNGVIPWPSEDIHCRPVPHVKKGKNDPRSVDRIVLYHYVLRSKEDYNIKIQRGGADREGRESHYMEYLQKIDSAAREKGGVCKEAVALADACCPES